MRVVLAGWLALLALVHGASAQDAIRLKTQTIRVGPGPDARGEAGRRAVLPGHMHTILQFDRYPDARVRAELAKRGVRVLRYVPDSALMVSAGSPVDLAGLGVRWAGPLDAGDKLSPELAGNSPPAYLVVLHPDADMTAARGIVEGAGFAILDNERLLPGQLVVTGNGERLAGLAAADDVAYILPASMDLATGRPVVGCSGGMAEAGLAGEYVTVGSGWPRNGSGAAALSYVFQWLPASPNPALVESEVERAFREWARYGNVLFTRGSGAADLRTISLTFARRSHGDAYPFDGPGGMLAHTFYPSPPNFEPQAGDMHLDADDPWTIGAYVDIFSVALHEAGHALGLGHSDRPGSVMYPYYQLLTGLTADDIAGIRALYGPAGAAGPGGPPNVPAQPSKPPVAAPKPSGGRPQAGDTTPPSLRIVSPGYTVGSTTSASITVGGVAGDNVGVTVVQWSTSLGFSGTATGTVNWTARIPLLIGTNVLTVRAYDAAGNSTWRALTVVRH